MTHQIITGARKKTTKKGEIREMTLFEEMKEAIRNGEELPDACNECNCCTDDDKCEDELRDVSGSVRLGFIDWQCPAYRAKLEIEAEERGWIDQDKLLFGEDE